MHPAIAIRHRRGSAGHPNASESRAFWHWLYRLKTQALLDFIQPSNYEGIFPNLLPYRLGAWWGRAWELEGRG
jgi:hypothetical protein